MSKKQTLTKAELEQLLFVRFQAEQSKQVKLQARLLQELGHEVDEEKPSDVEIKNIIARWVSKMLAHRLKQNRRTAPLFSSQDFSRFVSSIFEEPTKTKNNTLNADDLKTLKELIKPTFNNILEMVYVVMPLHKNPYEEYWRWVNAVIDVATNEYDIPPTELPMRENATDEVTRRMFSRGQFIKINERTMHKLNNADVLKEILIQQMLGSLASLLNQSELCEMKDHLKVQIMPRLRKFIKATEVVINAWLKEEVNRIYLS